MPSNKNALLRYRTIDRCLRDTGRSWTLDDLVEACSDALYEAEGRDEPVGRRTVQLDIQMMRSDRLGYAAPIEVYDRKYYRYSDPGYSINARPMSAHDIDVISRTVDLLRQYDEFDRFHEMADVASRLQLKVDSVASRRPAVDFERNPDLRGLGLLNPLYDAIAARKVISVSYQPFSARSPRRYTVVPHMLKEYRNRWFLFATRVPERRLVNLALDRMAGFSIVDSADYFDNPDFGPDYFDNMIGVTKTIGSEAVRVEFTASRSNAGYIATKPLHKSQRTVRRRDDGAVDFELTVVINPELITQLLGFGDGIRVTAPQSLVATIASTLARAAALYAAPE